jgi:S-adenosylmethionine:diacylglycerol 3-amino-3-carboxypropyl transferase
VSSPARPLFALVREDSTIERALVARTEARRVVVVASGGCTALSLLSDTVEQVIAVDVSPAQAALVALRAAAIAALDRDAYLRFCGARPDDARSATWASLRAGVPDDARAYWDAAPEAIAAGVDGCGVTEAFYRFVAGSLRRSDWPDGVWRALLSAGSMDEQRELLATHFAGGRFRVALEMLLSRSMHELFYPPSIFAHVAEHDFARVFARRFGERVMAEPMRGNYFLSQLIFGEYLLDVPGGAPPYLTQKGYAEARRNLHKLRLVTGALQEVLDPSMRADALFLSNVLDWASEEQTARIGDGVRRAARPGAVVVVRHMLGRSGLPASFGARFDAAASAEALRAERALLYGAVSVGWVGDRLRPGWW